VPLTATGLAANRLLTALPQHEWRRFQSKARLVELPYDEILADTGKRIRHAYFPVTGFITMTTTNGAHPGLEVGLIGDEGMYGIALVLGVDVSTQRATVQGAGAALRMDAVQFRRLLDECPVLRRVLQRYAYVLMSQLVQSITCTRFHLLEARLARLLLMIQDRAQLDPVHLTHEALALRLGVRRAGVTTAAIAMQRRGLIRYHRGDITFVDRANLHSAACTCYAADNATYAGLMGRGVAKTRMRVAGKNASLKPG
jgi:CRP-like cAMP-binding protein